MISGTTECYTDCHPQSLYVALPFRARRGRDARPPADLYRRTAGQDRQQPAQGGDEQSAVPARRDRQAGPGFPRRSGLGAARGARSRTEQQVPGSLSGGRYRPVGRDVRSEEHTSELQSLMRFSYAVVSLKEKNTETLTLSSQVRTVVTAPRSKNH